MLDSLVKAATEAARAMDGQQAWQTLVSGCGEAEASRLLKYWDPTTGPPKGAALKVLEQLLKRQLNVAIATSKKKKKHHGRRSERNQVGGSKVNGKKSSNAFRNRQRRTDSERSAPATTELVYIQDRYAVYGLVARQVTAKFGGTAVAIQRSGKRLAIFYPSSRRLYMSGNRIDAKSLAEVLRLVVDHHRLKPRPTSKPLQKGS